MRTQQSEDDEKLKASIAATEAAGIFKQAEHQVYNQYATEMKTMEFKNAEDVSRRQQEQTEAISKAIGTNNV